MTPTARTRPPVATPSRRPSGVVRATLYDPNVKHGTDACTDCTSIGTNACASGFGVAFNQRCDVAWLPGLGKRAETLPKKGSIPSHSATLQCCCIRDRPECIETLPDNDHIAAVRFKVTGRVRLARQTGEPTSSASSALSIASSNTTSVGFRRPLLATLYAATQTGLACAPSLYPVIGVAAPITTSRSYAGHRCMNTGHERDSYSVVTPARRAPGFRPTDAGGSFFAMRELMAGAR